MVLVIAPAEKEKKEPSPPPPKTTREETLDPPVNSTQAPAVGPNFPLTVTITSTLPPQGVTIEVSAKVDGATGSPFFSINQSSTSSINNFSITNTPQTVTCVTTVTVTSKTNSGNKWTGTYRYSRK